ncbi:hypothetical protein NE236_27265 [Actinoallomurus purpureus]|uniref:hypothetical protein n=1 Tax=Actinoallomurus purpureus TaxID=478114 RepID=UPI002092B70E|nr:hypothetical protein [Actinoallomurus purpureus]MCO6008679.1 hypothetical protein [Actinoallomurus purpureus]
MRSLLKTAVVGAGIAAVTFALATPASANSFSSNVGDGTISYNDASDTFCAQAYNSEGGRLVEVNLVPLSRSGPSPSWTDRNDYYGHPGAYCQSLSSAYEDTYYRADVRTYWAERDTWVTRGPFYFYS